METLATVHDGEDAGFRDRLVEHPDIVPPAMGDIDEAGDIAPQIQRGMERDRRFRAHERRPGKAREAEIGGDGIERVNGATELDTEAVLRIEPSGDGDRGFSEIGVDAPVALLVGVGQSVARDTAPMPLCPNAPGGKAWSSERAGRPRYRAGSRDRSAGRKRSCRNT